MDIDVLDARLRRVEKVLGFEPLGTQAGHHVDPLPVIEAEFPGTGNRVGPIARLEQTEASVERLWEHIRTLTEAVDKLSAAPAEGSSPPKEDAPTPPVGAPGDVLNIPDPAPPGAPPA